MGSTISTVDVLLSLMFDCVVVSDRGQRAAVEYQLNELLDQLSIVVQQTPPDVDANSNNGTTTTTLRAVTWGGQGGAYAPGRPLGM